MKKSISILISILLLAVMAGCGGPGLGSKTYMRDQTQTPMRLYMGTVLSVSQVKIEKEPSGIAPVVGGIAGAVVGSTIGGGSGKTLATTAGALAGLGVGEAVERNVSTVPGLEIEVEMDDGRIMVIVQGEDDVFMVGDRVRIIEDHQGRMRVRQ